MPGSASVMRCRWSMDADRAARQILDSIRRGEAERVLSVPARIAAVARALVPEVTADVLAVVIAFFRRAMALPGRGGEREQIAPPRSRRPS